jgi:hypothetical protein
LEDEEDKDESSFCRFDDDDGAFFGLAVSKVSVRGEPLLEDEDGVECLRLTPEARGVSDSTATVSEGGAGAGGTIIS